MNDLIIYISQMGWGKTLYDVFFALGFVSVLCGLIWLGKKLKLPLWKIAVTVVIVYPLVVLWMFVMFWIESGFTAFGGNNIVRIFVYVPLFGLPVARMLQPSSVPKNQYRMAMMTSVNTPTTKMGS